jgi:putative ABC transport system permease protein
VLVIRNAYELDKARRIVFKEELKQLQGVANVSMTDFLPVSGNRSTSIYFKDATLDQRSSIFPQSWEVDADWIPTMDMKMAAGRNFSKDMRRFIGSNYQ